MGTPTLPEVKKLLSDMYFVIKKEDLQELDEEMISAFKEVLLAISSNRAAMDKGLNNQYVVINTDESYIGEILTVLSRYGHLDGVYPQTLKSVTVKLRKTSVTIPFPKTTLDELLANLSSGSKYLVVGNKAFPYSEIEEVNWEIQAAVDLAVPARSKGVLYNELDEVVQYLSAMEEKIRTIETDGISPANRAHMSVKLSSIRNKVSSIRDQLRK